MPPWIRQLVASVALALLALSPMLVVVGRNISWQPLPSVVLVRSLFVIIALVSIVTWVGQRLARHRLGELPTWAVSLLGSLAVVWTALAIWPAVTMPKAPENAYDVADAIIARTVEMPRRATSPPDRDIYLIVLDALGGPDLLRSRYGLDVSNVVASLKARGFTVATASRSAYPYTILSLASTLNFAYLDELAATVGPSISDLYPLQYLIHRNALFQLAKAAGYRVVMIGSDDSTTDRAPLADVCRCRQPIPHPFERAVLALTPLLSYLPIDRWAYAAHRAHLRRVLSDIGTYHTSGRQFVMVHLLAPHPPFVFSADGPVTPKGRLSFFGPDDEGIYRQEYRGQAHFVLQQITRIVDDLLARNEPRPVILIQGDHGPRRRGAKDIGDLDDEFGIFFASLFPDRTMELPDSVSPLNAARALASEYFGADLPPLAQHQWRAELMQPYALTQADVSGP